MLMSAAPTQEKTNMTEIAMDVQGVSLRAGGKRIVHAISFTIKKGEFIGMIGSNGSGKTSLMTLLAGAQRPHDGAVLVPLGSPNCSDFLFFSQFLSENRFTLFRNCSRQYATCQAATTRHCA